MLRAIGCSCAGPAVCSKCGAQACRQGGGTEGRDGREAHSSHALGRTGCMPPGPCWEPVAAWQSMVSAHMHLPSSKAACQSPSLGCTHPLDERARSAQQWGGRAWLSESMVGIGKGGEEGGTHLAIACVRRYSRRCSHVQGRGRFTPFGQHNGRQCAPQLLSRLPCVFQGDIGDLDVDLSGVNCYSQYRDCRPDGRCETSGHHRSASDVDVKQYD